MDVLPGALERLTDRVDTLERRVRALEALEHPSAVLGASEPATALAAEAGEGLSLAQASGAFPVLGKAMLGVAGAYLLRAVAESTSLPRLLIAAVAIVYALLWLVAAARVPAEEWFSSAIYAGTSALILAPMLWELTLNFKVLPAPAAAGILGTFVIAATALAWKRDRAPVFWVAYGTAAAAALALAVATHDLDPFIATLLLMALTCEYAAGRSHQRSVRFLAALASDAAIWALIFIYANPQSARMDYPALSASGLILPGCLLFLIYGVSAVHSTALLGQKITASETGQVMIAFLLAASSLHFFAPGNGAIVLGAVCLMFSGACYLAAFALFAKAADSRNFQVFAAWAAILLVAGSLLCLSSTWLAAGLGLSAIAATVLSARMGDLTLRFHGLAFLGTAAVASGLAGYAFRALAGTPPTRLGAGAGLIAVCALIGSAASRPAPEDGWKQQFVRMATAALAVFALAALLIHGLLFLTAHGSASDAPHVAFMRTLVLCALALALAYGGPHWRRVELTRLAYAALGLVAAKLLFEDLRHGNLEFIAASIFLFAIALIAVPRLVRMGQKQKA
jgi:hypothetical protein